MDESDRQIAFSLRDLGEISGIVGGNLGNLGNLPNLNFGESPDVDPSSFVKKVQHQRFLSEF